LILSFSICRSSFLFPDTGGANNKRQILTVTIFLFFVCNFFERFSTTGSCSLSFVFPSEFFDFSMTFFLVSEAIFGFALELLRV